MKREEYAIRNSISGKEIAEFIGNNDMNRESFARMMNVSKKTVDYWVKKDTIEGPIVFLLTILKRYPELIEYYHIEKAKFPLRLYYMNGDDISTIIDVDVINRKVRFRNYTDDLLLRAFGIKERVTYEEYESFLESRCFPRERDMIKLELSALGLPYYDPFLIVEKTQGRLEDDDCWIRIEKVKNDKAR